MKEAWGFKAAARVYHIAQFGHDVEVLGPYTGTTPTTIAVAAREPVPGTTGPAENLYDLSQILAWVASHRRDVEEQLTWRAQVRHLLSRFEEAA